MTGLNAAFSRYFQAVRRWETTRSEKTRSPAIISAWAFKQAISDRKQQSRDRQARRRGRRENDPHRHPGDADRHYIAGISSALVTGTDVVVNGSGRLGVVMSSARFKRDIRDMARPAALR
jgi:hypothetical protein